MTRYDLPLREAQHVQLIQRGDGRYYRVPEVDQRMHEMEKELRRCKALLHIAATNPIIKRMYGALGVSKEALEDAVE